MVFFIFVVFVDIGILCVYALVAFNHLYRYATSIYRVMIEIARIREHPYIDRMWVIRFVVIAQFSNTDSVIRY